MISAVAKKGEREGEFRPFATLRYLKVITLNINEGHNKELMEQCQILREYAQYVAKVREFAGNTELNAAVELAVNECIQNNILAEFLRKNKSEVIAMSIFEYDQEEEEKKLRKAEYEAGKEEGIKEGIKEGIESGIRNMLKMEKYSVEEIAEVFKISIEEVEQIKRKSGC